MQQRQTQAAIWFEKKQEWVIKVKSTSESIGSRELLWLAHQFSSKSCAGLAQRDVRQTRSFGKVHRAAHFCSLLQLQRLRTSGKDTKLSLLVLHKTVFMDLMLCFFLGFPIIETFRQIHFVCKKSPAHYFGFGRSMIISNSWVTAERAGWTSSIVLSLDFGGEAIALYQPSLYWSQARFTGQTRKCGICLTVNISTCIWTNTALCNWGLT